MKNLLLGLLLIASYSGSAQAGDITISGQQGADIKTALSIANLNQFQICVGDQNAPLDMNTINGYISGVQQILQNTASVVTTSSNQSQPLITVKHLVSANQYDVVSFAISADLKTVTEFTLSEENEYITEVNTGTLLNPILTSQVNDLVQVNMTCHNDLP